MQLEAENARLENQVTGLRNKLFHYDSARITDLEKTIADLQNTLASKEAELEVATKNSEVDAAIVADLQLKNDKLDSDIKILSEKNLQLVNQTIELDDENMKLSAQNDELKEKLEKSESTNEILRLRLHFYGLPGLRLE